MPIPHDEAHRFLNPQPSRESCIAWGQHFENVGAPYEIAYLPLDEAWTIYKHHWDGGHSGHWCCGATA